MGTRLSIWPEGHPELEVGNDHKLYCYSGFKYVERSFTYLFNKALAKTDTYSIYLEFDNSAREAYDTFCCCAGEEIVLSEDEFREFSLLYLMDFVMRFNGHQEDYERVAKYMFDMAKIPGNKVLDWGVILCKQ